MPLVRVRRVKLLVDSSTNSLNDSFIMPLFISSVKDEMAGPVESGVNVWTCFASDENTGRVICPAMSIIAAGSRLR